MSGRMRGVCRNERAARAARGGGRLRGQRPTGTLRQTTPRRRRRSRSPWELRKGALAEENHVPWSRDLTQTCVSWLKLPLGAVMTHLCFYIKVSQFRINIFKSHLMSWNIWHLSSYSVCNMSSKSHCCYLEHYNITSVVCHVTVYCIHFLDFG